MEPVDLGDPYAPIQVRAGARCCGDNCFKKVKDVLGRAFSRYGEFVGSHPVYFIVLPIFVFGGLGLGLLTMESEGNIEEVYFPKNSQALKDRETVRNLFPNMNNVRYNPFSQSDTEQALTLIFVSKNGSIFQDETIREAQKVMEDVKALTFVADNQVLSFSNVCAKSESQCVVDGEFVLTSKFQAAVSAGAVTYPYWTTAGNNIDLKNNIANVKTKPGSFLTSASVLKISFILAEEAPEFEKRFEAYAANLSLVSATVAYETPNSLNVELDKSTKGDILIFSLTISLCCTYASVVSSGGDPVSTRSMLAFGGILAAGLGIVGSMGLLSLCGVEFVNIVGVVPFLIIGIGVDDMFLIMSSWSGTLGDTKPNVPKRVGATMASAGIGITITSLTDLLAFVIGTTSVFKSVTNFSLYAGVAVFFCYIANVTFFNGCLAVHGYRVFSSRSSFTCKKLKSREKLKAENRHGCYVHFCGGSPPQQDRADESIFEKFPSLFLHKIFTRMSVCILIIVSFLGFLAVSIYGTFNLPQGLVLQNLVLESSYYHRFLTTKDEYFPTRLPVGFIIHREIDYTERERQYFLNLLAEVRQDSRMMSGFERCWLSSYLNSTFFDASAPSDFVKNLLSFLANASGFLPDVVFDSLNTSVIASRCFVMSEPNTDQYTMADLMTSLRKQADNSPLPVFAFHSAFVAYEQFLAVLPATLQMVGCAVAVMTVVTFLLLPHFGMVCLVVVTIIMILTGVFGFLYFWDLSLSSITMIHLVMSVGFSVDFSAHVCAAYLLSDHQSRKDRAADAIRHAAGPILNGATSTLLGVLLLAASSSFIFFSFFQVMFLVIVLGMLHAVLFLPAVLSLLGPQNTPCEFNCPVNLNPVEPIPETSTSSTVNLFYPSGSENSRRDGRSEQAGNSGTTQMPNGNKRSYDQNRTPTPPPDYD